MIDFTIPAELAAERDRVRQFVIDKIVPFERDPRLTAHGPNDELRQELVELARAEGLLTVQAPKELGGRGLTHVEQAVLYEASGWSTLGPVAMNCAAPDEGNMFLLSKIADEEQTKRYLQPVIDGHQRSVFAMTEPGGAGSDPNQLATAATFDGENFTINGRKWLITGADGAKTWIIMARLAANPHLPEGPTLFLCDGDQPGIVIERIMNTMDRNYVGGHAVVNFENLVLPKDSVLGETGQALRYAQLRLAPARLTHCMRWLGAAERAQAIAIDYAKTRTAFGKPIGEHQGVSFLLADNEIALHQCRLTIWHACWLMDQGEKARHESSIAKSYVSEELFKVTDRCVQVLGGIGISDETVVEMIFRDMRAFRLYDGPTEVHKYAIGRQILRGSYDRDREVSRPLPSLWIVGRTDGNYGQMTKARDKVLAAWKLGDGRVLADNPGYTTTEYGGPGPVLQFWAHNYSAPDAAVLKGHCMPGGTHASMLPLLPEFWAGTSCAPTGPEPVFSAGEVAMDFFLAHPRQP